MTKNQQKLWYDVNDVLSYNAMINYITGGRGTGKTFGFKEWCLKKEGQFVWIRRYATELKKCKKTFLNDLRKQNKLPPGEWKVTGDEVTCNGKTKGYFMTLSKSMLEKSGAFGDVDVIIFDEALLGPGVHHYLPDEVSILLELIETINRLRTGEDGRKEVRVFCLANKVSYVNPHFAFWHICETPQRFTWAPGKKGLVLVENYKNELFAETKRKTRMGQLIDGTDYGAYSIDNEAWFDDDAFIEPRPPKVECMFNIRIMNRMLGAWMLKDDPRVWFSAKTDPTKTTYAGSKEDHGKDTMLLSTSSTVPKALKKLYETGELRFEDTAVKALVIDVMQRYATLKK